MQKALSDSHLAIYDEQNTANSLRLQYEDIRKQERQDNKRIKELEALNQDIVNKLANVHFKDSRPEISKKNNPLGKKERALAKVSSDQ